MSQFALPPAVTAELRKPAGRAVTGSITHWLFAGCVIVRDDDSQADYAVLAGEEDAQLHAEWVTGRTWDDLEEAGWKIVPVHVTATRIDA